ncbi:FAD-dependent oxidoreductase [Devosia lacusdianchii]|uniref:FAD-dependent oxidoreductase n=1 Tax=Devosia lacusdianchii TaxID=2917991 RepID=UPI001F06169F|nr:FAD-dependent oxidoreductase [Devosia sp. JXJ CY 41]
MTKGQPNRLSADNRLAGTAIDHQKALQFRLDGRVIEGFAGDTVLSAVLASGIDTAGRRHEAELGLSARHVPAIAPVSLARDPQQALAMERTPALADADYVTLPAASRSGGAADLLRRLRRPKRSLGLDLNRPDAMQRPWFTSSAEAGPENDLIVVGGGLAGLSAALAGAKAGLRVTLVEAWPRLGGHARLFGTLEDEEKPDESINRLVDAVTRSDAISVLTHAEVFAARPGAIRVHVIDTAGGAPAPRVVDLHAPRIVLATGTIERLPVFPGNRLPGIAGTLEAFEMAYLYGVWPGQSALFATVSSPAYRLAMLARDAGVAIPRIIDGRPLPQSRFIEFSKAYGITLAAGTIPASARPAAKGKGLTITPQLAFGGFDRVEDDIGVDRLIVSGGWQPDLTLWHMAGGPSRWNAVSAQLEAQPGPAGIALAGSAAGYVSNRACLASGGYAVDMLLGRKPRDVHEHIIDPIYETPDAPAPVSGDVAEPAAPAFLDAGRRYIVRPRTKPSRWPAWLPFGPKSAGWSLADTPQPLDIADIAAGVQLGAIPATSAGIVAQERVAMVAIAALSEALSKPAVSAPKSFVLPGYLAGRFGGQANLWMIAPTELRVLEVGALMHRNADATDPMAAVGVVAGMVDGAAIALIDRDFAQPEQTASVREQGRAIAVRLVSAYRSA